LVDIQNSHREDLANGSNASFFAAPIEQSHERVVPSLTIYEVLVAGMGLVLYGRLIEPVAAHDVLGAALAGMLLGAMIECYRRGQAR
jgi:hypothetical protein